MDNQDGLLPSLAMSPPPTSFSPLRSSPVAFEQSFEPVETSFSDTLVNAPSSLANLEEKKQELPPGLYRCKKEDANTAWSRFKEMSWQRIKKKRHWFVYLTILLVNILIVLIAGFGVNTPWYQSQPHYANPYAIGIVWVIFLLLSMVSLYMVWDKIPEKYEGSELAYSAMFIAASFLTLMAAGVYHVGHYINTALLFVILTMLTYGLLMISLWHQKAIAGIFLLPIFVFFGYLAYLLIANAQGDGDPVDA